MFGLRGELKLAASRIGHDALQPGLAVTLRFPDGRRSATSIAGVRFHQGRPLIALAGVDDAAAAQACVRADVLIARDDAPLHPGEFFDADLIGCRVIDAAGVACGDVVDVVHYPSQDMLVVGAARALVPLVRAFIVRIDIDRKEIHVDVPPGLLDPAGADEA